MTTICLNAFSLHAPAAVIELRCTLPAGHDGVHRCLANRWAQAVELDEPEPKWDAVPAPAPGLPFGAIPATEQPPRYPHQTRYTFGQFTTTFDVPDADSDRWGAPEVEPEETPAPPEDRSDLIAMGNWVADCLDARNQLVFRTIVRHMTAELERLAEDFANHVCRDREVDGR